MLQTIFGIARSEPIVRCIVDTLLATHISVADISLLCPAPSISLDDSREHGQGSNAITAAANGYALNSVVGLLEIPGVGPFIAAGPIRTALSSTSLGATVGGISGALIRLGIPGYDAKIYVDKIKNGNTLIAAQSRDTALVRRIRALFKTGGMEDIGMDCKDVIHGGRRQALSIRWATYPAIRP